MQMAAKKTTAGAAGAAMRWLGQGVTSETSATDAATVGVAAEQ